MTSDIPISSGLCRRLPHARTPIDVFAGYRDVVLWFSKTVRPKIIAERNSRLVAQAGVHLHVDRWCDLFKKYSKELRNL